MRRMTFSPLASRAVPDYGKRSGRDRTPVSYLIVHHWAGTSGGDARLLNPSEQVSASYILYGSGELVGQVPEEFRPWTSGSWDADAPAVTVETQNSANGGDWPVSDEAVEKLAQLAADLCQRYGWGSLDRSRVRGHREFYATACPGPYLWARLDAIVARGNEIINQGEDDMTPEQAKKLEELHGAVFGDGKKPRGILGALYDAFFKREPTTQGYHAGVLSMLNAVYDADFKEVETSRGTPGGTLMTLRIVLEELAEIRAALGIEKPTDKPTD